jgi:hypothetical protein
MKPNPSCTNAVCRDCQVKFRRGVCLPPRLCLRLNALGVTGTQAKRQQHVNSAEYVAAQAAAAASSAAALAAASSVPLHAENEWNISVVGAPPPDDWLSRVACASDRLLASAQATTSNL